MTQTYTVTVTRAGSADASLSALSLSGVTLTPVFASGTTAYTASVGHGVMETTVTATASDGSASVEVTPEDADDQTLGDQVALAVGETTVAIEVIAEDGETTRTYMVTVTRAGSANASLSSLSLSGVTLKPVFASGVTVYTASVANSVTETMVTATTAAGAAHEVKLNGVADQDGVVGLVVGVWQRDCGGRDGAGWCDDADIHGDGDAGRVYGGESERAFAVEGWWGGHRAVACLRAGDYGVHGGSRPMT